MTGYTRPIPLPEYPKPVIPPPGPETYLYGTVDIDWLAIALGSSLVFALVSIGVWCWVWIFLALR